MGTNKRQRELEEFRNSHVKKSTCAVLVVFAVLAGAFIGNTATVLYMSPKHVAAPASTSQPQDSPQATGSFTDLQKLEAATAKSPGDAHVWIDLGNFCFDNGLNEKAVVAYERALELDPVKHPGVWSDLGVMYRRVKRFEDAVKAFDRAAELDPGHVTSRFNMGVVLLHDLNRKADALAAWKAVLAVKPDALSPSGVPVADMVRDLEND
ncbi:tetratricopeptide repeat protein [Pseudodesulfovibrio tunisiensis]|uniref:tetratricopeptide repeat protein n=1 Tax=Pseudodesulfovibrio tunisiensis TaxID=463192 RepID=UPI001FB55C9A|nr:tetratricopeptide repeat protein [Pseudodesulfovibrio tunisiensis]